MFRSVPLTSDVYTRLLGGTSEAYLGMKWGNNPARVVPITKELRNTELEKGKESFKENIVQEN